ncbi:hypothetical protein PMAYCL1PPCAC_11076 [Pristionchus mayeri]|uniref:Peptidase S1 domain-containing protein n=1 Tax=Pristionchus mayeri TaxID=1317129 RepID=A0AAN5CG40_9BILA|nr:hypothetical protein PMAYCL1PPCAC_11076 [Pristionchus mayeri]
MLLLLPSLFFLFLSVSGEINDCGISNPPRNRIIGGNDAPVGKWPWQVQLLLVRESSSVSLCGGSIIAPRCILTAAHCLNSIDEVHKIMYGSVGADRSDKTARAANFTIHEKWESNKYKKSPNDIALIELEEPIQFDGTASPVCLPSLDTTIPVDAQVVATGFGLANDYNNTSALGISSRLKETVILLVPHEVCNFRWHQQMETEDLRDTQICAGSYGHGSMKGDSGGPLVIFSKSKQWFQIGVVSSGPGYSLEHDVAPEIYTNVAKYCDWIEQNTRGEAKCTSGELIDATASGDIA